MFMATTVPARLVRLPDTIAEYARRWSLTVLPPFPNLSYNYVAPAVRADGMELVLKLGVPDLTAERESAALRHYEGRGSARLIEADPAGGAILIERLRPGTTLATIEDDVQATAIAAEVMRQLWRPAPQQHGFPNVTDWADGLAKLRAEFGGGTGPFPTKLIELAERLFAELLASQDAPVLLHGDLHHENILAAAREPWLAIDPRASSASRPMRSARCCATVSTPSPICGGSRRGGSTSSPKRLGSTASGCWAGAWHRRCCRAGGATRTTGMAGSR